MPRQPLSISLNVKLGGDDWRNFEPMMLHKTVNFTRIDEAISELQRIHRENPTYFDVPAFTQKVY